MRHNLVKSRKKAKLGQADTAELLDISHDAYSRIETGRRKNVDVELALKISDLFGESVEYFFANRSV